MLFLRYQWSLRLSQYPTARLPNMLDSFPIKHKFNSSISQKNYFKVGKKNYYKI